MNTSKTQVVPTAATVVMTPLLRDRLRVIVADRADDILAEVPNTLRRLRTFLLVLAISVVPLFMVAVVTAVLWYFLR